MKSSFFPIGIVFSSLPSPLVIGSGMESSSPLNTIYQAVILEYWFANNGLLCNNDNRRSCLSLISCTSCFISSIFASRTVNSLTSLSFCFIYSSALWVLSILTSACSYLTFVLFFLGECRLWDHTFIVFKHL